jgi:hypothetical protein
VNAQNWQFVGNALVGQDVYPFGPYPAGNYLPSTYASLGLDANNRLGASSGLKGKATDSRDIGADIDAMLAATAGVVP